MLIRLFVLTLLFFSRPPKALSDRVIRKMRTDPKSALEQHIPNAALTRRRIAPLGPSFPAP